MQVQSIESVLHAPVVIPDDFLDVLEPLKRGIDRRLGYTHDATFACFWADDEGGVAWSDGARHGSNSTAAATFVHEVAPLGERYRLEIFAPSATRYALVLDRARGWAYLAPLASAREFLLDRVADKAA
jgi:hypothetical protein